MARDYRLVNVGTHVNPPPGMWVDYFPPDLRDLAPVHVTRDFPGEGEFEALVMEGVAYRILESQLGVQTDREILMRSGVPFSRTFAAGAEGGRDPAARIRAMDQDDIDADVLVHPGFPTLLPRDRRARWGLMHAFNRWLADFCAHAPGRLIGVGELPLWDIDLAVREARAIAALGLKGVLMPAIPGYVGSWSSPADKPYTDPVYKPLWSALEEHGLVMVVHADAAAATPALQGYDSPAINMVINKALPSEMIGSFIIGNIFAEHPGLRLVCVETGVGWMAHLVMWMDELCSNPGFNFNFKHLKELPSITFRRHVAGSFLFDTMGVAARDAIGVDSILWCNDYPHSYSPWPNSLAQIGKDLAGVGPEDRHKILAGNAVRIFGLG